MATPAIEAPSVKDGERASAEFVRINEAYPGVTRVHVDPPIYEVRDFVSAEEIERLLAAGLPGLKRSIVVDAAAGKSAAPSRTSESCYLNKPDCAWLGAKIAALTGKPFATHEPPQVARYSPGQFYLAHLDGFDVTSGPGMECATTGGQRVATVLIYLNTVGGPEAGGATFFPRLNKRFFPEAGKAVVFFPCTVGACGTAFRLRVPRVASLPHYTR